MDKLDTSDLQSLFMNPSTYSNAKDSVKKTGNTGVRRNEKKQFSRVFEDMRNKAAEELGISLKTLYNKLNQQDARKTA